MLRAVSPNLSKLRGETYSMFSGLPVSVQGLSNMPPLSGTKQAQQLKTLDIFVFYTHTCMLSHKLDE